MSRGMGSARRAPRRGASSRTCSRARRARRAWRAPTPTPRPRPRGPGSGSRRGGRARGGSPPRPRGRRPGRGVAEGCGGVRSRSIRNADRGPRGSGRAITTSMLRSVSGRGRRARRCRWPGRGSGRGDAIPPGRPRRQSCGRAPRCAGASLKAFDPEPPGGPRRRIDPVRRRTGGGPPCGARRSRGEQPGDAVGRDGALPVASGRPAAVVRPRSDRAEVRPRCRRGRGGCAAQVPFVCVRPCVPTTTASRTRRELPRRRTSMRWKSPFTASRAGP
jgi:hypothetical protein